MGKFIRFFLTLMMMALAGCTTVSEADQNNARLHWQLGNSLLMEGQYPAALKELLAAEALDPESPTIQNSLGLVYFSRNRVALAEKRFRQALKFDAKFTDARNNLGRILIELKRYEEAYTELKIASEDLTYTAPEKPLFNLGYMMFLQKKYDAAIKYLNQSLDFQNENCDAQNYLGRAYYEQNKMKLAAPALDRAVSFCQSLLNDEPSYFSGMAYLHLKDRARAKARFTEVIKLYPNGKYVQSARTQLGKL